MKPEIIHSDEWEWKPLIPEEYWRGWYIQDEEMLDGPYETKEAAEYALKG